MSSIRRQINIAAPIRAVWRMITTPEGWTSWYADAARFDARSGGRVTLTTEGDDGEPVEEVGILHIFRPTSRIEIAWDARSPAPTRGSRIVFNLAVDGAETRLSLVHSQGEILENEESRQALDDTWRRALSSLRDTLEAG